jgi:hypothetical protein
MKKGSVRERKPAQFLLLAGGLLLGLAILRLVSVALSSGSDSRESRSPAVVEVKTELAAQLDGIKGEQVRLHFSEVPLNIDFPYGEGRFRQTLEFSTARPPSLVVVQVLNQGLVVGQSVPYPLSAGASTDLGTVKLQPLTAGPGKPLEKS